LKLNGDFKNDTKDGQGKLYLVDGSWFEGTFVEDRVHGKGLFHFSWILNNYLFNYIKIFFSVLELFLDLASKFPTFLADMQFSFIISNLLVLSSFLLHLPQNLL